MLRITTNENSQTVVLRLEGRLGGPWVGVLAECWAEAKSGSTGKRVCIDLKDVSFIDVEGKARLTEMYAEGAELLGEGLETKAIVAEIRGDQSEAGGNGEAKEGNRQKKATNLSEELSDLQRLHAELHAVNEELARAARPLKRLDDLNEEQRRAVATQIRAGLARWESVTQQISQTLGSDGAESNG